jgi:hypothetical protein
VLGQHSSQSNLYELSTRRLVIDFLNGYNATTVVYGQTGSGKSYSMFGESESNIGALADRKKGIVPRACAEIFQAIAQREKMGIQCQLGVSYVEIYGDYVADLLRNGERVGHSQVASQRFVLAGLYGSVDIVGSQRLTVVCSIQVLPNIPWHRWKMSPIS